MNKSTLKSLSIATLIGVVSFAPLTAHSQTSPVAPAAAMPSATPAPTADLPTPVVPTLTGAPAANGDVPLPLNTTDTPIPPAIELPVAPVPPPSDVPAGALNADQVALIALRHQPSIAEAAGQLKADAGRAEQAKSGLLPTLGASASYSNAHASHGAGTTITGVDTSASGTQFSDALSLRQLLFDFGHTSSLSKEANALEKAGALSLTSTQSDTVLTVKQNFYAYAQAERLVSVNEDNYRAQVLHLDEARALLTAGTGIASDVVSAQTNVSDAVLQLNVARNNASIARVALAVSMGLDPRTQIVAAESDEPAPDLSDPNALISAALRNRPDVQAAQANVDAAKAALAAARTYNAPAVIGTLGVGNKDESFPPQSSSTGVGVTLSFNPFDSGYTSGGIRVAQGNLDTYKASLASVEQSVASDVAQAYLNERLAHQRVADAQDEVTNADESVRLAEGRFRAGIGIFLEITDAQQLLVAARTNLVNARSATDQARAALAHAIGAALPTTATPSPAPAGTP